LEFCVWEKSPRSFYTKLAVRTREIKGAFKGVAKYRTSQPTSSVGCSNPAVLHLFSPRLHSRLLARLSDVRSSQCANSAPFVISSCGCLWAVEGRLRTNGEIALPCSPWSDDGYGLGICTSVCPVEERMDLLTISTTASQRLLLQHNRASFITNCRSTSPVMPKLQSSAPFVRRQEICHCWVGEISNKSRA